MTGKVAVRMRNRREVLGRVIGAVNRCVWSAVNICDQLHSPAVPASARRTCVPAGKRTIAAIWDRSPDPMSRRVDTERIIVCRFLSWCVPPHPGRGLACRRTSNAEVRPRAANSAIQILTGPGAYRRRAELRPPGPAARRSVRPWGWTGRKAICITAALRALA